jgi:hypothetical protein
LLAFPQGLPQTVSGHQVISSASESSVKDFESDENVSCATLFFDGANRPKSERLV